MWELILLLIGGAVSIFLAWEDMTHFRVSLWALVLLGVSGLMSHVWQPSFYSQFLWANLLVIVLMLVGTRAYFFLRGKGKFMDELFGWGDLVMFFVGACWFETMAFIGWYLTATLTALIWAALKGNIAHRPIPLVAFLGMAWIALQLLHHLPMSSWLPAFDLFHYP